MVDSIFLIDFFSNFIFQHFIDCELSFLIYFGLFSMRLLWSYDPSHEFGRLIRDIFLVFFKIDFLFNFIHQHWVDWKLCFIIYFDFLYMGLFKPYDSGHEFGRLTRIFLFTFYKVILVSWLESWVWHVYSSYFFCVLF